MEATIEEILDRVQLADPEASRERAVGRILTELRAAGERRRRRRWFGALLSLGAGGLIAVSPVGQAVADFITGGDDPPQLSAQDLALTRIACQELGSDAASVSWCNEAEDESGASAEQLLEERGYEVERYGPAMAIEAPDGQVLITGMDELDPDEMPDEIGGIKVSPSPNPNP